MGDSIYGEWTTHREIKYLEKLPLNLLKEYLKSMHKRTDWGQIDAGEIFKFLQRQGGSHAQR